MHLIPKEFAIGEVYFPPLLIAAVIGIALAWMTARLLNRYRLSRFFFYPPLVLLALAVLAFIAFETVLFVTGIAERLAVFLFEQGGVAWLLVLGGFTIVSMIASRSAHDLGNTGAGGALSMKRRAASACLGSACRSAAYPASASAGASPHTPD